MSKKYGLIISKEGVDVNNAQPKDLVFSTLFDTYKLSKTGTLNLSLPAESITEGSFTTRSSTYAHGLGYSPVFYPETKDIEIPESGNIDINDYSYPLPPAGAYGPSLCTTFVRVFVDSLNLTLWARRINGCLSGTKAYPAQTLTVTYTIFYNRADEVFNYL